MTFTSLLGGSSKRESMHKVVMKQLTKLGINVINGDYIEDVNEDYMGEPKTFTTKKGVRIEADVVIVCVGGRPNVPFPAGDAIDGKTRGLSVEPCCAKILVLIQRSLFGRLEIAHSTAGVGCLPMPISKPCMHLWCTSKRQARRRPAP
jgi:hypothetical protein